MSLFIFSCVSLYFSSVSAFPLLFPCTFSFFMAALLCAAGGLVADLLENRGNARLIGLLFPLMNFYFGAATMDYLILLLPVLFTCAIIIRGNTGLEYYSYRSFFRAAVTVWGLFFVVIWLFHEFESMTAGKPILNSWDPLKYALLSALCSVLLLRQLRIGVEDSQGKRLNRNQLFLSVGGMGAILAVVMLLEQFARSRADSLKVLLEKAFLSLYSVLLSPFVYLVHLIKTTDREKFIESITHADPTAPPETVPMPTGIGELVPEPVQEEMGFPWWLAVLILIVLAVLLFFMMRLLSSRQAMASATEVLQTLPPEEKKKKEKGRSNRQKVRAIYREYLRKMKKAGVKLRRNDTSEDILMRMPKGMDETAAKELRSIYLSARYNESAKITPEQVKKAGAAQRKIKN